MLTFEQCIVILIVFLFSNHTIFLRIFKIIWGFWNPYIALFGCMVFLSPLLRHEENWTPRKRNEILYWTSLVMWGFAQIWTYEWMIEKILPITYLYLWLKDTQITQRCKKRQIYLCSSFKGGANFWTMLSGVLLALSDALVNVTKYMLIFFLQNMSLI